MRLGTDNKNSAKTQELITCKQKRRKSHGVVVSHKIIMDCSVILLGNGKDVFKESRNISTSGIILFMLSNVVKFNH